MFLGGVKEKCAIIRAITDLLGINFSASFIRSKENFLYQSIDYLYVLPTEKFLA